MILLSLELESGKHIELESRNILNVGCHELAARLHFDQVINLVSPLSGGLARQESHNLELLTKEIYIRVGRPSEIDLDFYMGRPYSSQPESTVLLIQHASPTVPITQRPFSSTSKSPKIVVGLCDYTRDDGFSCLSTSGSSIPKGPSPHSRVRAP